MIYTLGIDSIFESDLFQKGSLSHCIEMIESKDIIALDTETEGMFNFRNKVVCLQLSNGVDHYFIETRGTTYLQDLKPYIEKKIILGQNLKFDYKFLKLHGIELNRMLDTFLAECILTCGINRKEDSAKGVVGLGLGLDDIAERYLNVKLDKSVRNQFIRLRGKPFSSRQIIYGTEDVAHLHAIYEKQLKELESKDLVDIFNLECKVLKVLAEIEYTGMCINSSKWLELAKRAGSESSVIKNELEDFLLKEPKLQGTKFIPKYIQNSLFDAPKKVNINWDSPKQTLELFQTLGFEIESTESKHLIKYQNNSPFVKKYLDYKETEKLSTTYGKEFLLHINPITNRIHTNFWQVLSTHRISSSDPNLQQIPADKEYLACFEAPDNFKIVGCDFSGQELRIITQLTKDPLWVSVFNNNGDIHSEIAAAVFNIPISEVKEKKEFVFVGDIKVFLRGKSPRDVAKTINFMLAYGGSEYKLSDSLGIEIETARTIINGYFEKVPLVKSVLDKCSEYGVKLKYVRSLPPYKIRRNFKFDEFDNKAIGSVSRASKNTPIQSTGAIMTKLAMIRLYEKIKIVPYKVELFLQVHDALFCYVEKEYAEEWAKIQQNIMEETGREFITLIPVKSDIVISDYWSK